MIEINEIKLCYAVENKDYNIYYNVFSLFFSFVSILHLTLDNLTFLQCSTHRLGDKLPIFEAIPVPAV